MSTEERLANVERKLDKALSLLTMITLSPANKKSPEHKGEIMRAALLSGDPEQIKAARAATNQ